MSKKNKDQKTRIRFGKYGQAVEFAVDKLLSNPAIDHNDEKYTDLLNDLQANILKRHIKPNTNYYFLHFETKERFKEFLANLSDYITTAKEQLNGVGDFNLNIYLTYPGYQLLDLPKGIIPQESAFSMGMQERTKLPLDQADLNDSDDAIHAIVMVAYEDKLPKIDEVSALEDATLRFGFKVIYKQSGQLKNPLIDEFQFEDGISNPRFFPGAFSSSKISSHVVRASELPPMQIVLTHDRTGNQAFSCGSYGVFAKFAIDETAILKVVETLKKVLDVNIERDGKNDEAIKKELDKRKEELAKAHILGRFMDGTPLALSDQASQFPTNNFNYRELINSDPNAKKAKNDNDGSRCPFHTHIRKANPRQEGDDKRRIVRRGLFYDDPKEKGLLFISFQNSLEKQFEYILNSWMLSKLMSVDEDYTKLVKTNVDILFSKAGEEYLLPKTWNGENVDGKGSKKIKIPSTMITFRGGIYFFVPSVSFFKKIKFSQRRRISRGRGMHPKKHPFLAGTEVMIHADRAEKKAKYNFIKDTVVAFKPKK